ncbi:MAG: TPM domain-containing protein [Phycisphaerales bacterium]
MNLKTVVSESQRAAIEAAVVAAEAHTAAEIVPVIATASGRYDRAEDLAGVGLGVLFMIGCWILFQREDATAGDWNGLPLALPFIWIVVAFLVGFFVGLLLTSRVWFLRRLLTSGRQMREEVAQQARQMFFDQRIHRTRAGSGILIYVSMYERLALVLADESAQEVLGEAGLNQIRDELILAMRGGSVATALCAAIKAAGDRLEGTMPRQEDDRDELPSRLVLLG